jgi:hypothetical protein
MKRNKERKMSIMKPNTNPHGEKDMPGINGIGNGHGNMYIIIYVCNESLEVKDET